MEHRHPVAGITAAPPHFQVWTTSVSMTRLAPRTRLQFHCQPREVQVLCSIGTCRVCSGHTGRASFLEVEGGFNSPHSARMLPVASRIRFFSDSQSRWMRQAFVSVDSVAKRMPLPQTTSETHPTDRHTSRL